ncbi:MAG: hypothetical protein ACI83W_000058 [Marinoscillum sp.]|jgi:hypothetical protein
MENSWYSLDVSPWWILLAFLLAVGLSAILYSKKSVPWGRTMNLFLGFLRTLTIFLLLLLLINPKLEINENRIEKPIVILALDNSTSVIQRKNSPEEIKYWISQAEAKLSDNYDVRLEDLQGSISDSIDFDAKTTNIGGQLQRIKNVYQNQNLASVVLLSDGILNRGQSPTQLSYYFPIQTVGLGDTIVPKDISIKNIRANRVAYQGNKYPISVQIGQKGFDDEIVQITAKTGKEIRFQKQLKLSNSLSEFEFSLDAQNAGINRLTIEVEVKEGETSDLNNKRNVFIEVIEGKDRILILAPAPHPDIQAISSTLNSAANYEVTLYIPGIHPKPKTSEYDAIIEHQAFSGTNYGDFNSVGKWYILGNSSNLNRMVGDLNFLSITKKGGNLDKSKSSFNSQFSKFKLKEDLTDRFKNYPPIEVPFGDYQLSGPSESLLFQQIGSVVTQRPLLVYYDDGTKKTAVLTGAGLWQWKLQEGASEENSALFNDLILKSVQYLSIKNRKDRFVAKVRETDYQIGDRVWIDTECYSEIFERSFGNTIKLSLRDEAGQVMNYDIIDSPVNSSFSLGSMEPGVYFFTASTVLGGKPFERNGTFSVRNIEVEDNNLTANHNLLKELARNTSGEYYHFTNGSQVADDLLAKEYPSIIHTETKELPMINSIWILALLGLLLSTEWFLRKYLGSY